MDIFKKIKPLSDYLQQRRRQQASIGLVPTMGDLHQGHSALIRASKADNKVTVCSIYVNPKQFNDVEDFARYPQGGEQDLALLEAERCEVVFMPEQDEMYSPFDDVRFDFGALDKKMEGRFRPGHFSGVALVVAKLFNIVRPDVAYFGQKDYQQLKIVTLLKRALKFPLELRDVPIARATDGLALSSRNQRLTGEARTRALFFFEALNFAKKALKGETPFHEIRKEVQHRAEQIDAIRLEYFELADCTTLDLLDKIEPLDRAILLIAGYVGEVRLIDNMMVACRG